METRIELRIINTEKNQQLLENTPKIEICDLSIIAVLKTGNIAIEIITHDIMNNKLNISEEELFAIGKENCKKDFLHTTFSEFFKIPFEMIGDADFDIITNNKTLNGVISTFICTEELYKICKQKGCRKLTIIPSSIHECIILPFCERNGLKEVVYETNRTQIEPEEVLSDNVYIFDSITNRIEIL